jgi:hypothetical protein
MTSTARNIRRRTRYGLAAALTAALAVAAAAPALADDAGSPPRMFAAAPLAGGWAGDDAYTVTHALLDGAARVGTATVTCAFPDGAPESTCMASLSLTGEGTLVVVFAPEDTWGGSRFTVAGGTGEHAGATGSGTWSVPGRPVGRGLVTLRLG